MNSDSVWYELFMNSRHLFTITTTLTVWSSYWYSFLISNLPSVCSQLPNCLLKIYILIYMCVCVYIYIYIYFLVSTWSFSYMCGPWQLSDISLTIWIFLTLRYQSVTTMLLEKWFEITGLEYYWQMYENYTPSISLPKLTPPDSAWVCICLSVFFSTELFIRF
jgi:hypothetical protein